MTNKDAPSTYFVIQTNPEVFEVAPRPGNLLNIDIAPKRNRLKEEAAKAAKEAEGASETTTRKSRTSQGLLGSKSKLKASDTQASTSRKSLLTVTSTYDEPKQLDIDQCPREYKVQRTIAATPWSVEFDDYLDESRRIIADPFQDSVHMLAMSISVVMLLARRYEAIDENHFKWIYSYLDCIRDEFGQVPPNVQGILNHIKQVSGGKIKSFLDEEVEEAVVDRDTTVRISAAPPRTSTGSKLGKFIRGKM